MAIIQLRRSMRYELLESSSKLLLKNIKKPSSKEDDFLIIELILEF